jgi:hypothetical protein
MLVIAAALAFTRVPSGGAVDIGWVHQLRIAELQGDRKIWHPDGSAYRLPPTFGFDPGANGLRIVLTFHRKVIGTNNPQIVFRVGSDPTVLSAETEPLGPKPSRSAEFDWVAQLGLPISSTDRVVDLAVGVADGVWGTAGSYLFYGGKVRSHQGMACLKEIRSLPGFNHHKEIFVSIERIKGLDNRDVSVAAYNLKGKRLTSARSSSYGGRTDFDFEGELTDLGRIVVTDCPYRWTTFTDVHLKRSRKPMITSPL